MKTMIKGFLSWIRKMRKLQRDLRKASASPQMCHPHFTGKILWITCSGPCECVPWQPWACRVWQEGIFILPAKSLPLWTGFNVFAPNPTPSLFPAEGTYVCTIAIISCPFYSLALALTSSLYSSARTCTWKACSEKAPDFGIASFSSAFQSLSYFVRSLSPLVTH